MQSDQTNVTSGFCYRGDPKRHSNLTFMHQSSPFSTKIHISASLFVNSTLINVMKSSLFTKAIPGKHGERAEALLWLYPSEASQRMPWLELKFTFVSFSVDWFYAGLRLDLHLKQQNISKENFHPEFHTRSQRWPEGDNSVLQVFLNRMGKIFHVSIRTFQCWNAVYT